MENPGPPPPTWVDNLDHALAVDHDRARVEIAVQQATALLHLTVVRTLERAGPWSDGGSSQMWCACRGKTAVMQ